jgi:hypothetical protein
MTGQTMSYLFGSDAAKETDGVVIQYGTTLRVRLARAGGANISFAKVMEEVRRPFARIIANELLPEETARTMLYEAYARSVVKEWSGMLDDNGTEIPFSVENCITAFEKYPDFFQFVFQESQRLANYRKQTREDEAKN